MNDVYAAPEVDSVAETGSERQNFQDLDFKTLKKLYNHSSTVTVLAVLWTLGTVISVIAGAIMISEGRTDDDEILGGVVLALGCLQGVTVVGMFMRAVWGRILGFIICVLSLPSIPIGTAIGIFGLIALGQGGRLFGADRYLHRDLKAEFKHRKKNNIN